MDIYEKKVLIIDDEIMVLKMLSQYLVQEGFNRNNIALATSGKGAERELERLIFDIVISDFDLNNPILDGLKILKRLRAEKYHPKNISTPFLLISGNSYNEVKDVLEAQALTRFVNKPVSPAVLIKTVRIMLSDTFRG